ncbi:MAG: DNA repair protein RecN [Paludibacteraceae bacterium]|nr:DNA repair protein RecN [Paludibacteraceae bacterium]
MLKRLLVENYALIDRTEIELYPGFSVITGETGAGKSILLGALNLLLGQRSDSKAIKNPEKKCVVEAVFDIAQYALKPFFEAEDLDYDDECVLRREISSSGKSRSFVNDTPVNISTLKSLGEHLLDIHSQHENLLLSDSRFQLQIVDSIAQNKPRLQEYEAEYTQFTAISRRLNHLKEELAQKNANRDYAEFQLNQLREVALSENEQEELEAESEQLAHATEIKEALSKAVYLIDESEQSVNQSLKEAVGALNSVSSFVSGLSDLSGRLDSCLIEVKDILHELDALNSDMEVDPNRLDFVNDRLDVIYTLEKKHNVDSVSGLLALQASYEAQLQDLDSGADEIVALEKELAEQEQKVLSLAQALSDSRKASAPAIESELSELLHGLGMPNARVQLDFKTLDKFGPYGMDAVTFLFSANKDRGLNPIASIASGGEISRVMLALKYILSKSEALPTIIFDEIDTGVSGEIAAKMGAMMQNMSSHMQVLSITHLPQIASKGACHYKVYKQDVESGTVSCIKKLSGEDRVAEIAQMLSGANLTEAAINNAKELLKDAGVA